MITNEQAAELAAWLERIGAPTIGLGAADTLAALYSKISATQDSIEGGHLQDVARRLRRACLDVAVVAMAQSKRCTPTEKGPADAKAQGNADR